MHKHNIEGQETIAFGVLVQGFKVLQQISLRELGLQSFLKDNTLWTL